MDNADTSQEPTARHVVEAKVHIGVCRQRRMTLPSIVKTMRVLLKDIFAIIIQETNDI